MTPRQLDLRLVLVRLGKRVEVLRSDAELAMAAGEDDLARSVRVLADELDSVACRAAAVLGVRA
jgi:phage shock protein A